MGLVDDVDLVAALGGDEHGPLAQFSGVVHQAVGGGVHLDDVQCSRTVGGQGHAGVALLARLGGRALLTVQRPGQDARAGGLAATPGTREQVGVVHAVGVDRTLERFGHMFLPDDVVETSRTVFAVQR